MEHSRRLIDPRMAPDSHTSGSAKFDDAIHAFCPVIVNDAFAIKMLNVGVEAPERPPPSKAEVLNGVSGDLAPSRTWSFLLLVLREPHKVPSCEIISSSHSSTKNASSLF